ncbi:MAG: starch-binding protein [Eubacteriales bacterium]|nr:starch-binding protein [Eubacteriales bacterium]
MKKTKLSVISIFLVLMMLLSTCAVMFTVNAAKGETIYFEKPDDWNDPVYIYWWEGSGAPSWPGKKLTNVAGNIYSFTDTNGIGKFNINDGGSDNVSNPHQTVNLTWPGNDKLCVVGKSAGDNSYGNECWNASWTEFSGVGLSVSTDTPGCEFMGLLSVTLKVSGANEGTYTLNGSAPVTFLNGETLTLGENGKAGDIYKLELSATDGADTATAEYTYILVDSPIGASIVYFDNSKYGWETVYCYAYGTVENAEWPGQLMSKDEKTGYYYITFDNTFKNESIIFTNGLEKTDEGYGKYPAQTGLPLKVGQCKLLTAGNEWVDYGKPDSQPYGFAYTASGTKFSTETINVDIDLKSAVSGTYSIDGGSEIPYTGRTTITVGEGKIGNSDITLTLKAKNEKGLETTTVLIFKKTFTASETTVSSPSDGHTTEAIGGYYGTNPDLKLGSYKTGITVDGNPSDWDSSMLIAQGVANDDPRVYMPSSIHERAVDDYALYAAWDDENLYFMWEMANTSAILGGKDIFSAQKPNGSIWNPGLPMYLLLSVDPEKHADGKARELDIKSNTWVESSSVWGSGLSFDTNIDTFIAFDSANTNGGAAIIPLDDEGFFNYSESVNIGRPTNNPGVLNNNGFKIGWDYGTLSDTVIGINGYGGSRSIGDTYDINSDWVDFFDLDYKKDAGFIYEVAIPMKHLGIDKSYVEENGIGAMLVSTFGTSAMNTLPHDPSCLDNADKEYSLDPSSSHEKEDADHITVPLARVGALLKDTVITKAPLEVNFGADKAGAQGVGSEITITAEAFGGEAPYTYEYKINGKSVSATDNKVKFTPDAKGEYKLSVKVTDALGTVVEETKTLTVGEAVPVVIPPTEPVTEPSTAPATKPEESTAPTAENYYLGDADMNGKVNVKDATLIQKHVAGIEKITGEVALLASDADQNGNVNVKDATAIQKFVANMPVETPIGETVTL